jgi:hypothetical protein
MTEVDIVIDEIRQGRREMSERCGHDPAAYIAYLRELEQSYSTQIERYRSEYSSKPSEVSVATE